MKELIRFLRPGCLLLILTITMASQAAPSAPSSVCDYYVDNYAGSGGSGSLTRPWNDINDHVGDLIPGDTMCVRGDISGSGRVYPVDQIYLNSNVGLVRNGVLGNPITVRSYPDEKVILKNVGSDSIVYFRGADYWGLDGFVMDNNGRGSRAVRFEQDASHNVLRNNEIYNGKTDGVAISSGHNVGNVIENNHIHHFDAGDKDAHCIGIAPKSDDTLIRGNVIHDCSGDGIQIFATDETPVTDYPKNVRIVDNVFYRGSLPRSEDGIDIKGVDGLETARNELYGYYERGIIIQKGGQNLLFDSNTIHDTSGGINGHGEGGKHLENVTLTNNQLYNINGRYAILFDDVYEAVVYHNTIANMVGSSFRIEGNGLRGGNIRNNLVYNSGKADIAGGTTFANVTVGYNAWFEAESEFAAPTDIVGSGNPGFVDAANADYHLSANSPAREAGTDVGVTTDFEGDPRPYGDRPDIGADEYWPTLRLTAIPRDHAIWLSWTEYENPALATYVITYTHGTGSSDASQGSSPLPNIPSTTHAYALTDLTNYTFYTVTAAARDSSGGDLAVSNSVRAMPTDIFVYLPVIAKSRP